MITTNSVLKQSNPVQSRAYERVSNVKVANKNDSADKFQGSSNVQNTAVSFTGLKSFLAKFTRLTAKKTVQKAELEIKQIPQKTIQPEVPKVVKKNRS